MIEHIHRGARIACASVVLLLAACGGGGGGGGGGTDLSTAPGLALSPTSVSFTAIQNGALPSTQSVQVTITQPSAFGIVVGFPPGTPNPTWLNQSQSLFSCTPSLSSCTLVVAMQTTSLPPGAYTTTVRILIGDVNQNPLAFRDLQVSYTVQAPVGLASNPTSLSFSQVAGAGAPAPQTLGISELGGTSYPWNASIVYQSGLGWLNLDGAGSTSGSSLPASLSASINTQVALLGTLKANIHITGNGRTLDVPVNYTRTEPQLARSPASLTFNALRLASNPPTQDVTLTTQGSLPLNYNTSVTYGAGASGWLNVPLNGTAPGTVTAGVNTTSLQPGSYTATLAINTATQSVSVSVTYVVSEPTLTRSPALLTFNAAGGGALPVSQDVTLSTQQSLSLAYSTSITYNPGASGWLGVSPTSGSAPGTATVSVNTTALAPGTYAATLFFNTAAQAVSVPVSYVISSSVLTFSPTAPNFTIDSNSAAAALSQTVAVGSTGATLTWTASSSKPWVTVSPTSGSSGTSVTLSLVPAELEKLDPGSQPATITFTYTPPGATQTTAPLSVSLNLAIPKISYVSPYVQRPSTITEVILRGSGFNSATGLSVMFGSNAVPTYTLVSDTEIRVAHPSLAAGSYPVTLPNQLGLTRSRARLLIAAAPILSATAIPLSSPVAPDRIVYDAERVAVYTNNNNVLPGTPPPPPIPVVRVERNRFVNPGWATDSIVLDTAPRDITMTPDGLELIALSESTLYHIDLASWTISNQIAISSAFAFPLNTATFAKLSMSNDGNALVFLDTNPVRAYLYNVLTHTFTQVPIPVLQSQMITARSSIDGSRILIGMGLPSNLYYYDSSLSQILSAVPGVVVNRLTYDRTGTNSIVDGTGYNRQFQALGSVVLNLNFPAISPDGSRGYGALPGESPATLRIYNLGSTDGSGHFVEITPEITLADTPGDAAVLGISDDGGTVFVAGPKNLVVQPVP